MPAPTRTPDAHTPAGRGKKPAHDDIHSQVFPKEINHLEITLYWYKISIWVKNDILGSENTGYPKDKESVYGPFKSKI